MPPQFSKASNLVTRCIANETIVVPVRAHVANLESIYSIDEVGSLIWQLIDGRTTVEQIVDAVCQTYEIGRQQAANDSREFLASLQAAGLIHGDGAAEGANAEK